MSAAHKSLLIFQMVRTACAPVQQLRPKAQGNTHGLVVSMKRPASAPLYPAGWDRPLIEQCEGRIVESRRDRTLERGGERNKNWQGHCAS
jgi:hypothetical protein